MCVSNTELVLRSPWATTAEPVYRRASARQGEKPLQWEACVPQLESSPCCLQLEKKACSEQWRPSMAKNKGREEFLTDVCSFQIDLKIQCNPNQNSAKIFVDVNKLILKFIWRGKRSRIANSVEQNSRTSPTYLKLDFKTVWYLWRNRLSKWNRIESPK